jgi:hypothetical protein
MLLHFHEDSRCQVELLPRSALDFCAGELRAIRDFADAHRDGDGFTDMYMRGSPPSSLQDLKIAFARLAGLIDGRLPFHETVTTGYSSFVEVAAGTVGFGSASCCLFFEIDEAENVRSGWLNLASNDQAEYARMGQVLVDIGASFDLLLVDWEASALVTLDDASRLSAYLTWISQNAG